MITITEEDLNFFNGNKKVKNNNKNLHIYSDKKSGCSSIIGRRAGMEDSHVMIDDFTPFLNGAMRRRVTNMSFYAVYDGHAGKQTASIVANKLHKVLATQDDLLTDTMSAIKKSFYDLDKAITSYNVAKNNISGCTAVVCVIIDKKVWFATLGDSEGILCDNNYNIVYHTPVLKPTDREEWVRITEAKNYVMYGRIAGTLAVSRAFGDIEYKRDGISTPTTSTFPVSSVPIVHCFDISDGDFVVLCCDGLLEGYLNKDATIYTDIIYQLKYKMENCDSPDYDTVSQHLTNYAFDTYYCNSNKVTSKDNITVLIASIA
jgi:serine/threonine protein phosphatase PrpC